MDVLAGVADVTTYFHLRLSTDGTGATGLTITDLDLQYVRSGVAPVAKVDAVALAATDTAHTDNRAIEIDATDQPGLYRVDWPDAAFAAGVREVILTVKHASTFPEHLRVNLTPVPSNAVQVGGTTQTARDLGQGIPNAVPGASGGLVIAGSNAATTFSGLTTGALACTTITASGAVAFQSTFAVTTSTALAALSCSTLTASGAVAFQSTFAVTTSTALAALSCSTLTASGAVAFQSTFAVTTSTSLGAFSCTTLTASGTTSLAAVTTSGTVTLNALTVSNALTISGASTFTGAITATNASNNVTLGTFTVTTNAIAWNAAWDTEVQSEVDDALIAKGLDHLVFASVAGADVADDSIAAKLVSKSATADWDSYDNTTDSHEAIRDRGDSAWVTATGFSTLTAAGIRTAVGLGSANLDTQLDALPTNAELATAITTGLTTALTEGYRGTGATGSVRDMLYEVIAHLGEFTNAGVTKTLKKLDGSTTAKTYTYDDADEPAGISETT